MKLRVSYRVWLLRWPLKLSHPPKLRFLISSCQSVLAKGLSILFSHASGCLRYWSDGCDACHVRRCIAQCWVSFFVSINRSTGDVCQHSAMRRVHALLRLPACACVAYERALAVNCMLNTTYFPNTWMSALVMGMWEGVGRLPICWLVYLLRWPAARFDRSRLAKIL